MTLRTRMTNLFHKTPKQPINDDIAPAPDTKFKIVVIDFQDNIESSSGENTSRILQSMPDFEVQFFDEPFNKSFLNLESRTLFDMIDKGQVILDKTGADILVWGCRENDRIRLNFQTNKQYEQNDYSFVSLLDSLYLPAHLFNTPENIPPAIKTLLHGTIISAISPSDSTIRVHRKYLLKKDIALLSSDNSAKQLAINYMPFIMNFLGIIYLSCTFDSSKDDDFKITQNLFTTAIKHQDLIDSPLHLGCIYYHLGQLNDCAGQHQERHQSGYFRNAIANYRQAQRYLGKFTYPYDYGYICYKLSYLFFKYWKQKDDIQALRDSVSQLREVEKIFTPAQFPEFWAVIEGRLGYLLSLMGNITKNADINQLAINCYKNQQKILTEKRDPLSWADSQYRIGDLHFKIGIEQDNRDHFEDALECYHDSLYIYENIGKQNKIKQLLIAINQTNKELKN